MPTDTNSLPDWVRAGEPVEIVHYNGAGDHVGTIATVITSVGARDIITDFDTGHRFTRRMYLPAYDRFERVGTGLRPHRYVLRRKLSDD